MKRGIYALIIVSCVLITSCRTTDTKKQVTKDVNLHIVMITDDVLSNVAGDEGIKLIAKRIKKYTVSKLNEYAIKISEGTVNKGDYRLTISIDTIESDSSSRLTTFSTMAYQTTKIKYTAKLFSDADSTLFVLTDDESEESLDEVTENIASKISKRVAKYFND